MANQQIPTNTFCTAKWIVAASASQGTHTTIAAAITAASNGDTIFIRPGTYVETISIGKNINLTAYDCDAFSPNVTIQGTLTLFATISISGINFAPSGGSPGVYINSTFGTSSVNLIDCTFSGENGVWLNQVSNSLLANLYGCVFNNSVVGINCVTPSPGMPSLNLYYCSGDTPNDTAVFLYFSTAPIVNVYNCNITNSGLTTYAIRSSPLAAGSLNVYNSSFYAGVFIGATKSPGCNLGIYNSSIDTSLVASAIPVTFEGMNAVLDGLFLNSTTYDISISLGAILSVTRSTLITSGSTAIITNASTLNYTDINCVAAGSAISVASSTVTAGNLLTGTINSAPPASSVATAGFGSIVVGTVRQNTLPYDIEVSVSLVITAATAAVINMGVNGTSGVTTNPVTGAFSIATVITFSAIVPAGYWILVTATGTSSTIASTTTVASAL